MMEYIMSIGVGIIIVGLIGTLYKQMMTKDQHAQICHRNTAELQHIIRQEMDDMKQYFDMKIENVVLKEVRKMNGGK